jgi:hypothetical protein
MQLKVSAAWETNDGLTLLAPLQSKIAFVFYLGYISVIVY